jgi:hypothetical protein
MPPALLHFLTILLGLLAIALAWYYRLVVGPRIPPDMIQGVPTYLRPGAPLLLLSVLALTVLVGVLVLFDLLLLINGEDLTSPLTPLIFGLLDLFYLVVIMRTQQRIDRSARTSSD